MCNGYVSGYVRTMCDAFPADGPYPGPECPSSWQQKMRIDGFLATDIVEVRWVCLYANLYTTIYFCYKHSCIALVTLDVLWVCPNANLDKML